MIFRRHFLKRIILKNEGFFPDYRNNILKSEKLTVIEFDLQLLQILSKFQIIYIFNELYQKVLNIIFEFYEANSLFNLTH